MATRLARSANPATRGSASDRFRKPHPSAQQNIVTRFGNAGTARMLAGQAAVVPKLEVGASNDPLEHQSDRVADKVVRMKAGGECASCAVGLPCEGCGETVHRASDGRGNSGGSLAPHAAAGIARSTQGGEPLPVPVRASMEPRFGADFSGVRIRRDSAAGDSARSIGARAYTLGNHIAFGHGQWSPGTPSGDHLIAHELTHTLQDGGVVRSQRVQRQQMTGNEFGGLSPFPLPPPGMAGVRSADEPDPNALYFTNRRVSSGTLACPGGCHGTTPSPRPAWPEQPKRLAVTKANLVAWSKNYVLESGKAQRYWAIQRVLRHEDEQIDAWLRRYFDDTVQMVLGSHEFTGPAAAREGWAIELRLERDALLPDLIAEFHVWTEDAVVDEIDKILHSGKVPPVAQFVAEPERIKMLETNPPIDPNEKVYRPGVTWFGRRVKAVDQFGYLWFEVVGHEQFYFEMRRPDWRDKVWSDVAEGTAGIARFGRFLASFAEALVSPVIAVLNAGGNLLDMITMGGEVLGLWKGSTCAGPVCRQYTACLAQGSAESKCREDLLEAAMKEATVIIPIYEQGEACLVQGDEEACGGLAAMAVGLAHRGMSKLSRKQSLSAADIRAANIRERIGRRRAGDPILAVPRKPPAEKSAVVKQAEPAKPVKPVKEIPAAKRDLAQGRTNLNAFAKRIGETPQHIRIEIKDLWKDVRNPDKVRPSQVAPERFDAEMHTARHGGHDYRRERAQGGQFWCRWSKKPGCGANPGDDFNAAATEALKSAEKPSVGRSGAAAREPFTSGRVKFELKASQRAFAALESASPGAQVYVVRNASGKVTYVGIVEQNTPGRTAIDRLQEHLRDKPPEFIGDAASIEVRGVGLEVRNARAFEEDLIREHKPKWNNPKQDPAAYGRGRYTKYRGAEPIPEEVRQASNIFVKFKIDLR